MITEKHRKFRLLSKDDTYCRVYDIANETEHRCFCLDHEIGDELFLFESEINFYTGYMKFEYSILNLYKAGEKYKFDIIRETDKIMLLSSRRELTLPAPLFFKDSEDQEEIELEIEDLDLPNNRLIFKKKKTMTDVCFDESDYSVFKENVIYDLPIIKTYVNKNQHRFAIAEFKGSKYRVGIPRAITECDLGNTIQVRLGYYKETNTPTLKLTLYFFISRIYEQGKSYSFTIEKQTQEIESGIVKWSLKDKYGVFHNYYPVNDITFNNEMAGLGEGDSVQLCVMRISQKGYLDLVAEVVNWDTINYPVEEVFNSIGYPGLEKEYFFTENGLTEDTTENVQEKQERSYLDQYHDGENLWVFSYLSYLDVEIFKELEVGNYDKAITLTRIYLEIERWILEGSDYLRNFGTYKTSDIISKAESKIERLEAMLQAIDLYLKDNDQAFLEDVKNSLLRSPYLNKTKKNTLKELVKVSQYFSADTDGLLYDAVILLIKHGFISEEERWIYAKSIEAKISRLRDKVLDEQVNAENNNINELKYLISNQFLLIFLNTYSENEIRACITSVNLLRFLGLYYNDKRFIDLAIELITKRTFLEPNILKHTDVFSITIEDFRKMTHPSTPGIFVYGKSGGVFFKQSGLEILPKNLNKIRTDKQRFAILERYDGLNLSLFSSSPLSGFSEDDNEIELMIKIINLLNYKKSATKKELFIADKKIYKGRIKSIGEEASYCFLTLKSNGEREDVLLHINSFHRSRVFDRIDDFLKLHDRVQFEITKVQDGKISISPGILIEEYAKEKLQNKQASIGIVNKVYQGKAYIITKEGWPVVLFNSSFSTGTVVDLDIVGYNAEYHHFVAENVHVFNIPFEGDPKELFRNFLIDCGVIYRLKKNTDLTIEEENAMEELEEYAIEQVHYDSNLKILITQLLQCLEQRISFIEDMKDIALHYYIMITLSGIIKSNKSFLYSLKLNNLAEILKLKHDENIEFTQTLSVPEYVGDDPLIKEENKALKLVKFLNTNLTEIPLNLDIKSNLYLLKKLIESYNLFSKLDNNLFILQYIKKNIIQELYKINTGKNANTAKDLEIVLTDSLTTDNSKETNTPKLITNLGAESKIKEFKSSIFYSASKEPQDKVILRTIAGFLNSYDSGGSLYIGVNDSGEIIGLKKDLEYSSKITTLDQYQNHIQSLIAATFPKEINALLDFKFHKSGSLHYFEIVIPQYDKPVPFENEFYQRQGVQTRILKGNDLIDFINRKSNGNFFFTNPEDIKNYVNEESEVTIIDHTCKENAQQSGDENVYDNKEIDLPHAKNYTSSANLLGNLYIFNDNTYMLSAAETTADEYLFKLPINEIHKHGSILLCYDNACINRMEIQSLLKKSFNKRYMNAMSDYGKLIAVFTSTPDNEVAIIVKRNTKSFIKIYHVSRISEHRIIGLKGNCIVQEHFDEVLKYHCATNLPADFDPFRRESRQGLGVEINKNEKLFKALNGYLS